MTIYAKNEKWQRANKQMIFISSIIWADLEHHMNEDFSTMDRDSSSWVNLCRCHNTDTNTHSLNQTLNGLNQLLDSLKHILDSASLLTHRI